LRPAFSFCDEGIPGERTLAYKAFSLTTERANRARLESAWVAVLPRPQSNGYANGSAPDIRFQASAFHSKTVFGIDTFKTGLTLHYVGSELDFNNSAHGTNATFTFDNNIPGNVHTIGSWTTLDWQISYKFGAPAEITPKTPKPSL
jgi:hypothetical protein